MDRSKPIPITEPWFDQAELDSVSACLDSRWVTQGPMTLRFEESLKEQIGAQHVLATTSCTAALHLAMMAAGIGPGDEVIVPALTWVTSAYSAEYVGARVVFVDIDPVTLNIDPQKIEAACTSATQAIVAVHLFGLAAPMDEIMAIARRRNLVVIEDAACGIGTTYKGRHVGTIGDMGCFSFHPRKVITTGEGGAVSTNDPALASALASLRNHGANGLAPEELEPHGPWSMARFDSVGFNLRLSDIQAAVGVAQMTKLAGLLADRLRQAELYFSLLESEPRLVLPVRGQGHTYQSYVVRLADGGRAHRNRIMAALAEANIYTRPGTHAVHRLGYYRAQQPGLSFPAAEIGEDMTITLPIVPFAETALTEFVAGTLISALDANATSGIAET